MKNIYGFHLHVTFTDQTFTQVKKNFLFVKSNRQHKIKWLLIDIWLLSNYLVISSLGLWVISVDKN